MIYTIQNRLGEINWAKLAPGDVVQVPYRAAPYAERIVILRRPRRRGCRSARSGWK